MKNWISEIGKSLQNNRLSEPIFDWFVDFFRMYDPCWAEESW